MVLSTFGFYFKERQSEATSHKSHCCWCRKCLHQHSHLGRALSFLESFSRLDTSLWYGQKGHTALVFSGRIPQLPSIHGMKGARYKLQTEISKSMRAAEARAGVISILEISPLLPLPLHSWSIKLVTLRKKNKPPTPKLCLLQQRYSILQEKLKSVTASGW